MAPNVTSCTSVMTYVPDPGSTYCKDIKRMPIERSVTMKRSRKCFRKSHRTSRKDPFVITDDHRSPKYTSVAVVYQICVHIVCACVRSGPNDHSCSLITNTLVTNWYFPGRGSDSTTAHIRGFSARSKFQIFDRHTSDPLRPIARGVTSSVRVRL